MSQKSIKPYVRALFDLASEAKSREAVRADLESIGKLIQTSPEFAAFLQDSTVSLAKTSTILKEILVQANPLTLSFLLYMAEQNRLDRVKILCEEFEDRYLKNAGVVKVRIISAVKLDRAQLERISEKLSQSFKSKVQSTLEVDPTLIGGFQVRIGDTIQDFSIKTQLDRFKQAVMAA